MTFPIDYNGKRHLKPFNFDCVTPKIWLSVEQKYPVKFTRPFFPTQMQNRKSDLAMPDCTATCMGI